MSVINMSKYECDNLTSGQPDEYVRETLIFNHTAIREPQQELNWHPALEVWSEHAWVLKHTDALATDVFAQVRLDKFNLTGVRTHDLWIMTKHFLPLKCSDSMLPEMHGSYLFRLLVLDSSSVLCSVLTMVRMGKTNNMSGTNVRTNYSIYTIPALTRWVGTWWNTNMP